MANAEKIEGGNGIEPAIADEHAMAEKPAIAEKPAMADKSAMADSAVCACDGLEQKTEPLPEGGGEMEYAIEVRDLVIRYRCLKKVSIKKSLLSLKKSKVETFEAVKGVTFSVPRGQIMGIVGKNGSGKSTLLRAIAGVFAPDEGSIDLHGHSVSLLSIGVGFQKKLTGRENILLSGMLLGFTEEQVRAKMKKIIRFSELGEFIDRPVRTYSSGMYSKLAFSITAILETEIMLVDEVLSVGDAKFRKKSLRKMRRLINDENRTVVIVSHNNRTLRKLCDTILWINDGEVMMYGPTEEVLPKYKEFMS